MSFEESKGGGAEPPVSHPDPVVLELNRLHSHLRGKTISTLNSVSFIWQFFLWTLEWTIGFIIIFIPSLTVDSGE